MKTEKELKEIREKLVFILKDEFLNEELMVSPSQRQRIRVKIGMIDKVLETDSQLKSEEKEDE